MNALKIYRSSAGSGKTYTLVLEYLHLVLRHPEDYRHILAITFTNKAADEMKSRVIRALTELQQESNPGLAAALQQLLPEVILRDRAALTLKLILHDYSSFSVSTIDSFFQRLLRSLAREIHLPLRLEIDLDEEDVCKEVVDRLLREAGKDEELTRWLEQLILHKIEADRGWNIEQDLFVVAKQLFRDDQGNTRVLDRKTVHDFYHDLTTFRKSFEKSLQEIGREAIDVIRNAGLKVDDFSFGKSGVAGYLDRLQNARDPDAVTATKRALAAAENPEAWAAKKSEHRQEIVHLAESRLLPLLRKAIEIQDRDLRRYATGFQLLKTLYLFGIVNDLSLHYRDYRNENNKILISDTPRLLGAVMQESDAPFIYEKVGTRYKYLLIDEFQDTSLIQWQNILPLLEHTLGSGFMALVVGDAKQSIYRWRGGDMSLLLQGIRRDLRAFGSLFMEDVLDTNYRSKREIVLFNNSFFEKVPPLLEDVKEAGALPLLRQAYGAGLAQAVAKKNDIGGFVRIRPLTASTDPATGEERTWKAAAIEATADTIGQLLKRGYQLRDITLLVRNNRDGNLLATELFQRGFRDIISPDSLLLGTHPLIQFLLNVFRYLADPGNSIAKSQLLHYYVTQLREQDGVSLHRLFADHQLKSRKRPSATISLFDSEVHTDNAFNQLLPETFTAHLPYLSKLPVYELSEQLAAIFLLNREPDAYLQRFQDLALEFTQNDSGNLTAFISWWDENEIGLTKSVVVPEDVNALRIMSIHKSKGLQFPIVIIPFTDWSLFPKANEWIWATTDEPPFDQIGKVALNTGKKLLGTAYEAAYREEIQQQLVDNANLLYVAFTRAEHELHIFLPEDSGGELSKVSQLVSRTCDSMDKLIRSGEEWQAGEPSVAPADSSSGTTTDVLRSYPIHRWQERISIASKARDLTGMWEEEKSSGKRFGIIVHRLLSEITASSDIERAVQAQVFDGLLREEEAEEVERQVRAGMELPGMEAYYEDGWTARAEQEILLPDGSSQRPDRVVFNANRIRIVDFKTGAERPAHRQQLSSYCDLLKQMGYAIDRASLAYLRENKVVDL